VRQLHLGLVEVTTTRAHVHKLPSWLLLLLLLLSWCCILRHVWRGLVLVVLLQHVTWLLTHRDHWQLLLLLLVLRHHHLARHWH
jgi:hypothetical protein